MGGQFGATAYERRLARPAGELGVPYLPRRLLPRSTIVIVGRSGNVGKPAVSLGYERQAAVLSIDEWASRTGTFGRHTWAADVLIGAAGRAGLIKAEHVRTRS